MSGHLHGAEAAFIIITALLVVVFLIGRDWCVPVWYFVGVGTGFALGIQYVLRMRNDG